MTSLRKFSIALLVVAALAGMVAAPAQAQVVLATNCNTNNFPSSMITGSSYGLNCSATGGSGGYTYTLTGTVPSGFTNHTFGAEFVLEGTATPAGTYSFTL